MKLTGFEAKQLRRFSDGISIAHFEPGINVFHGPNGAGKTSIIRALRAAFFERYQTTTVTDLRPWHDPGAAPSVQVQFEHDGCEYHLSKRFLKSASALLVSQNERYENAEADQKLAELLGFSHPAKGLNTPSHLGVPGLLWIEQGEGQEIQKAAGFAQDYLREALGQSIGDLTSNDADRILTTLIAERNQLLSADKKRKPKGEYDKTLKALDELEAQIATSTEQAKRYQDSVDQLAHVQAKLDKENRTKPWLAFETQIQEKQQTLSALKSLQEQISRQQADQQRLQAQISLHEAKIESALEQKASVKHREQQLALAAQAHQDAIRAAEKGVQQRSNASEKYDLIHQQFSQFEQLRRRDSLLQQSNQLDDALKKTELQLEQAKSCEQQVVDLTRQLGSSPVTEQTVNQVRELDREQQLLQMQLQASATRIQWSLKSGAQVKVDGQIEPAQGEHFITEPTELSVGELGTIQITPGGQGAAKLTATLEQVSNKLSSLLATTQATSTAALEQQLVSAQRTRQELTLAQQQFKILAPDGLAAQQALCANQQDQLNQLKAQLATLNVHAVANGHDAGRQLTEAQVTDALGAAREQLDRAESNMVRTDRDRINAQAFWSSAQREHQTAAAIIARADFDAQSDQAREQISENNKQLLLANNQLESLTKQLEQAQPDALAQDIERLTRSAESARNSFADSQAQRRELHGRLDEASANGAGETLAALTADRERVQRKANWFERRSAALCLLTDKLEAARVNATELLQAPLQKYLNRYLGALMPGASMRLTDTLVPEQLHLSDLTDSGSFDAQSFGTREQLALLTRLAYADLLREAGRPTLIILDDGLVHTDEQRLGLMKRILYQAASRHQILVFTCHEDRWADLGVTPRDIRSLTPPQMPLPISASAA